MATVTSSAGAKRPATSPDGAAVASAANDGPAFGRPEQRPRLEVAATGNTTVTPGPGTNKGGAQTFVGNIGDVDIMCRIACFIDTGQDLMNICVSLGRRDAAKIRKKYLLKNDAYLVKLLRRLGGIEDLHVFTIFHKHLSVFEKCRLCVNAWVDVNTEWRKRCTPAKMEKYKHETFSPLPFEPDVIFNNPIVAIEIGLLEVFRFLVEARNVDVNRCLWSGFHSDGFSDESWSQYFIHPALLRGDVDLLQYLLSIEGFDLTKASDDDGFGNALDILGDTIGFASRPYVSKECFKCLVLHPKIKVNLNHISEDEYGHNHSPLLDIIELFGVIDREERLQVFQRLRIVLEAGADPRIPIAEEDSHINVVRSNIEEYSKQGINVDKWKVVLHELEMATLP